ncbi:MAG: protein serine/threonine phosphatase [Bacteroidetes bacterium]|nr:MAG: protein serine/threonine phosphatase [Bacteroidota bacterium]
MRLSLLILISVFSFSLYAQQDSKKRQRKLDSLEKIVKAGPEDTAKVNAYLELGRMNRDKDVDKAFADLTKGEELAKKIGFIKGLAWVENAKGYLWKKKGDEDKTVAYWRSAIAHGNSIGDTRIVMVVKAHFGNYFYEHTRPDSSLYYYVEAYHMAEKMDDNFQIMNTLNGIAGVYFAQGDYERAKEYSLKLLERAKKNKDPYTEASVLNNLGNIADARDQQKEAVAFYSRAIQSFQSLGQTRLAFIFMNISSSYLKIGNNDSALYFSREGYRMAVEDKNELQEAKCIFNIAAAEYFKGSKDSALVHATTAKEISEKIKNLPTLEDAFGLLSLIYKDRRDYTTALSYSEKVAEVKDSIRVQETRKTTHEMKARFDTELKDKQIALLNKEKQVEEEKAKVEEERAKRNRIMLYAAGVGLLLVLLLLVFLFRRYREKQKTNKLLESQNSEISRQRDEIGIKNKEITDSINYARRIQEAMLPAAEQFARLLPQSFVVNLPKDIVSGDFYWVAEKEGTVFVAAVDCTGHGVPGGFMSMLGMENLNEALRLSTEPGKILSWMNRFVKKSLKQDASAGATRDGMDAALCSIDSSGRTLRFAGAYRPLWIIRNAQVLETKATKISIGGFTGDDQVFEEHRMQLEAGDMIYLFSDGYPDQFGGERKKKLMTKGFRELLLEIHQEPLEQQKKFLLDFIISWRGEIEQLDDILVIGIRVS